MSIYLDNNGTTKLDPRVVEVMCDEMEGGPSNPSSVHSFGQLARTKLTKARRQIAALMGVASSEIVFHSGGTEGLNTILYPYAPASILSSSVEHSAVYQTIEGAHFLDPGPHGAITPEHLDKELHAGIKLICLMAANNETGVMSDLTGIAAVAGRWGLPLLVDGVALLGREPFVVPPTVSAMCFSAHKFHGPKGVGFSILRRPFPPLLKGGPQEGQRRAGTENLAGIMGMAEALRLQLEAKHEMRRLRDRLEEGLKRIYPPLEVNGTGPRLCNTSNVAFMGLDGEGLMMRFDLAGVAVSHGSACSSGSLEPSRVLLNMGYSRERARSSLRFSLSRFTTEAEIDEALRRIQKEIGDAKR
ncbi:MAG: cysteine desulfurase [Verrucomicrobia bacterium]|nr:cysteine desulfurase [Verrucomicrobiota bacterium]